MCVRDLGAVCVRRVCEVKDASAGCRVRLQIRAPDPGPAFPGPGLEQDVRDAAYRVAACRVRAVHVTRGAVWGRYRIYLGAQGAYTGSGPRNRPRICGPGFAAGIRIDV